MIGDRPGPTATGQGAARRGSYGAARRAYHPTGRKGMYEMSTATNTLGAVSGKSGPEPHDVERRGCASPALRAALLGACALAALCAPLQAEAGHDVFHIFTPVVEKGHWGFEALSTFQAGLPKHAGHDEDEEEAEHEEHGHTAVRAAHEFALHGAVTDFWMAKLALGIARAPGDSYAATTLALENVFRLTPRARGALDFAWFTSVSAGLESGASHAVEFGPVVSLDAGKVSIVLNPFFEKTFGENREEGIAFAYGWRATHEIADKLAVGVEGYGEVETIGNAPDAAEQVHRIGPVLYLGHMHGARRHAHGASPQHAGQSAGHGHHHGAGPHEGHEHEAHNQAGSNHAGDWHAEVGVLFGLTEATPDAALKINVGADF